MNSELETLIERFTTGQDISIGIANEIEVALDNGFADDKHIQDTVEMLALYRPGGGEFLLDEIALTQRLIKTSAYLKMLMTPAK